MAFGLFKKQETADLILSNAKVCTMNYNLPWASAVAIKDEKILAVGDIEMMDELISPSTEIRDLDGKYVFPGFINIYGSPCMKIFNDKYLDLTECKSTDEVVKLVKEWAEEHEDAEVIFGFGYDENLKPRIEEFGDEDEEIEIEEVLEEEIEIDETSLEEIEIVSETEDPLEEYEVSLDKACNDRPVLLLCKNTITCWTNSEADRIIRETAEEEMVEVITVNYVLNLLIPFDFEEVEMDVKKEIEDMSDRGYTSVLDLQAPNYFESLYQDSIIGLYNEGEMRQRFFGTLFVNRPLIPKTINYYLMNRKTTCLEMGDMVHANMLNLYIDNENSPVKFTTENLKIILENVCEKGFSVYIDAINGEDMVMAYEALDYIREKNYKNMIVIASDYLPEDEELLHSDECFSTWENSIFDKNPFADHEIDMEEVMELLTRKAAEVIGMKDSLGTIEVGKLADLAIFDTNPYDMKPDRLSGLHADLTVLNGEIVYDVEAENEEEMFDLMSHMQL